ncbi:glycoside hydrolase family 68 protein [Chromohalobacter nigrandesensis]|uniref:glycoside hydrolase family 68 protein n=1 Tax=Chromohalobacter nigrandesensis TaxID=119863 RepID=UPI001FF30CB1|nr:glycoside hydrolase family 68 protein [Chromohalobacter nigrandesensis]MCK0745981.1 glycoside hydrolase family 68 protein [Chromohalobacter nigrandesensis]
MSIQDKIQTASWSRADALKVKFDDPTTTQPEVGYDFPVLDDDLFIWDTMPLRKLNGDVVSVDGWSIIFTLTADRKPEEFTREDGSYDIASDWENRHGRARICYWYAKDSKSWIFGGRVMQEGVSPTKREWAGTPILLNDNGDMELYYTAVKPGATMAKVKGRIETTETEVKLHGFDDVKELFTADGVYYQTLDQNPLTNFRDPAPFIDPNDGKLYMLFEGNVAGNIGEHVITTEDMGHIPPGFEDVGGARFQSGCVGIAVATDLTGDNWEILPPLVTAVGVNDQLERPHFVFKDGKYYLFTISHQYTYSDGLDGPDGVYGFVSDSLFGPFEPLNGSGLVLGNPSSQPFQTYSHCVMPNGLVTSFVDSVEKDGKAEDYRIGGTEAPTVELKIEGSNTYVVKVYDYGFIPPMGNVLTK